jgi:hypothetical protein
VGRTYSVNGYINAILRRTSPTLLVEGNTDKEAMHRLVAERTPSPNRHFNIDNSAIFDDRTLYGQGAKAKVLEVTAEVQRLTPQFKKLSSSFAFLIDREWDGLPSDPRSAVEDWTQPIQSPTAFVTMGHSIENYNFQPDCFLDYLRYGFAEHFSGEVEGSVRRHFPGAVALAGAITCQARFSCCLARLSGLISSKHIELSRNGRFYLTYDSILPISTRVGFDASPFVADVNAAVDSHWSDLSNNPNSRWVLHGHIGSEILWACVGLVSTVAGVPEKIGEEIAKGFQAERRRCCFTWLSRVPQCDKEPLDQAVDWLLTPQPADS